MAIIILEIVIVIVLALALVIVLVLVLVLVIVLVLVLVLVIVPVLVSTKRMGGGRRRGCTGSHMIDSAVATVVPRPLIPRAPGPWRRSRAGNSSGGDAHGDLRRCATQSAMHAIGMGNPNKRAFCEVAEFGRHPSNQA